MSCLVTLGNTDQDELEPSHSFQKSLEVRNQSQDETKNFQKSTRQRKTPLSLLKAPHLIPPLHGSQLERSPMQQAKTEATFRKQIIQGSSEMNDELIPSLQSEMSSIHERSMMSSSGIYNSRRVKKRIIQPNAHNSAIKHFPKDFFNCQDSASKFYDNRKEVNNVLSKLSQHYFPISSPLGTEADSSVVQRQKSTDYNSGNLKEDKKSVQTFSEIVSKQNE